MKPASLLFFVLLAIGSPAFPAQAGQDAIVAELLDRDFNTLETSFAATQHAFESGELSEYELRQAFEPFATLRNADARDRLREWVAQFPDSYVAHLALGLNDRALGSAARGKQFWEKTTPEQKKGLIDNFALAEPLLRESLALTPRPYLSLLNLITIAGNVASRPFLNATLLLANEALPSNVLARLAYARYLLPRWGGSYERFDAFVAMMQEQGVAAGTLLKLQAMALNDRGMVLLAEADTAGADERFEQALQLARQSGDEGGFRAAYLAASVKRLCKAAAGVPACLPPLPAASLSAAGSVATRAEQSGEDIDHAIVVPTPDRAEGVRTEYAWLALRHPGARRTLQALIPGVGRSYDMLAVTTADGRDLSVYFDITAFFGTLAKPAEP